MNNFCRENGIFAKFVRRSGLYFETLYFHIASTRSVDNSICGPYERQKGIAIYLAAVTLSIILAVALGVNILAVYQAKSVNETSSSVLAFAAAESGIEWALANVDINNFQPTYDVVMMSNNASYELSAYRCGAANEFLCVKSIGSYHNTQRAIKIQR